MSDSPRQPTQLDVTRLILRHRAALHGYVYACLRHHDDAEDVFQEVSLAIVQSFRKLQDEEGFLPWAREIAFRRILAHGRKAGRLERPIDPQMVGAILEASESLGERQPADRRLSALHACLAKLPPASRELVRVRYEANHRSVAETASRLGRTVRAVSSQLERIRLALRKCIERRLAAEATQ